MAMQVKLWGIRGSLPTPMTPEYLEKKILNLFRQFEQSKKDISLYSEFLKALPPPMVSGFGGHTACIQVQTPKQNLIIDGGSGLRRLGEQLMLGACGLGRGEVHMLFTHFHWDHLIGLPFFLPIFIPGNALHVYSVQPEVEKIFRHVFQKPYFPVPYERLGAKIIYHQLAERKPATFNDVQVTPYQLDHPDPCWGFKFEHQGKAFSYCVDTEGTRVSQKDLGEDLPLYQNVDLMIYDAQYSFLEAIQKVDWGHASAPIGLDIAMREGIKKVLFIHHDPSSSDEKIMLAETQTKEYYQSALENALRKGKAIHEVKWEFAREGMLIEV